MYTMQTFSLIWGSLTSACYMLEVNALQLDIDPFFIDLMYFFDY